MMARWSLWTIAAFAGLVAGSNVGQCQELTPIPGPTLGTPAAPQPLPSPAISEPLQSPFTPPPEVDLPPSVLEAGPVINPTPAVSSAIPLGPIGPRPIPGSLPDVLQQEYLARERFRTVSWRDTIWTFFPSSLLWEPPMAKRNEPRFLVSVTDLENYRSDWTLDTSIGTTLGLFRAQPIGWDAEVQIDAFAVVHSRLSPDDLLASDYRYGFPLTARRGPWHGKLSLEHTSGHLGDEAIFATGISQKVRYTKNEIVLAAGRWIENCLRLYGQVGFAYNQDLPRAYERTRYDVGFESYLREPTGWSGTPYAAANLAFQPEQEYATNVNVQLGWLWRNPLARLSQYRVFAEYSNGRSALGATYTQRENFYAFGMATDY